MIDRYLLRYFLAVVDHGTFSKAAIACRVTQPTLSVGIARLETLLDRRLFLRSNRRVEITVAGTRLAEHARHIEAEFIAAERAAQEDSGTKLIRIGVVSTLPATLIEKAVAAAMGVSTAGRLEIIEGRLRELTLKLHGGRIDVILGPLAAPREAGALFTERYAVALSTNHRLADRDQVTAEELAGEAMIVRRSCEALPQISQFFTKRGVRPFMAARTVNDERVSAYIRAGLGVTVMPRCFACDGIAMPTLSGFNVTRTIGFLPAIDAVARLADSENYVLFGEAIRRTVADLEV